MAELGLSLRDGMDLAGIDITELWQRYLAIGGNSSAGELARSVAVGAELDDHEHDLIAQAINDFFLEKGADHPVAYRHRS